MTDYGRLLVALPQGGGKTVTTIAAVEKIGQPAIIFVPTDGLRYQWAEAIANFTDYPTQQLTVGSQAIQVPTEQHCVIVKGNLAKREKFYDWIFEHRPEYVILGYRQLVDDFETVRALTAEYPVVIGDEITTIKGFQSDVSQAMKMLGGTYRFGLSGDPWENRLDEGFSIMEWIDADVLGDPVIFDQTYVKRHLTRGYVQGYRNIDIFHQLMVQQHAWYIKTDSDPAIAPYLPRSEAPEQLTVDMDDATQRVYDLIARELICELDLLARTTHSKFNLLAHYQGNPDVTAAQGKVMSMILALRMLCASPYVLRSSANRYLTAPEPTLMSKRVKTPNGWKTVQVPRPKPGSAFAAQLLEAGILDDLPEWDSPKLRLAITTIDEILAGDPRAKVVVFGESKDMLNLLETRWAGEAVLYHGDISSRQREGNKQKFLTDPLTRIFLSSDAGTYGTDLPVANVLVNYDHPYSGGKKRQRDKRHRRASTLEHWDVVSVLDLLVVDSIEEYYYRNTRAKVNLGEAIKTGRMPRQGIQMTVGSLRSYLAERLRY